jgi:alcohol dehydrogenase YqhD (iron-dependent ADH family)
MTDFIFDNKTTIVFGKDKEKLVGEYSAKYAKKILLHYGKGSIKRSGLYDTVVSSLKEHSIDIVELPGVLPNPRLSLVKDGIEICRTENIELILAVGGGSAIDSAKAIAAGVYYEGDVWDLYMRRGEITKALPVATVLTHAAAGSEASTGTVISDEESGIKSSYDDVLLRPVFSILNPELTFTLPPFQIACGAMDMFSHVMERYFTVEKNVELSDRMCEAVMRSIIHLAPKAIQNPHDYQTRAELLWASTVAHNDLIGEGRIHEWVSHQMEHEISAVYDVAHGAGLAVVFPAWIQYVMDANLSRFVRYATQVWDVEYDPSDSKKTALEGLSKLKTWIHSIGLPLTLSELGAESGSIDKMAEGTLRFGELGNTKVLKFTDVKKYFS